MQEVATILEIISSISSTLSLDTILASITEKTAKITGADSCAISRWDQQNDTVFVLADYIAPEITRPEDDIHDVGTAYPLVDYPATARVLHEHVTMIIYVDDPAADEAERNILKAFQYDGVLMVPMLYKEQAIGLLELYTDDRKRYEFCPDGLPLCQALANQAAVAIENARLFQELQAQRKALRQASLRRVNAQEEERRRLAHELHDELGQLLTALKINLELAHHQLPADVPAGVRHNLLEAGKLAAQAQETTRNLSLSLRPLVLDELGLIPALRWELDRYEQRTGQVVQFEANLAGQPGLPPAFEIAIYRIIAEALTNVARHAQASRVAVSVQVEAGQVVVTVKDNGQGFEAADWSTTLLDRPSLGLISMRERAELLGGQFQLTSRPGSGATVLVQLPLP